MKKKFWPLVKNEFLSIKVTRRVKKTLLDSTENSCVKANLWFSNFKVDYTRVLGFRAPKFTVKSSREIEFIWEAFSCLTNLFLMPVRTPPILVLTNTTFFDISNLNTRESTIYENANPVNSKRSIDHYNQPFINLLITKVRYW